MSSFNAGTVQADIEIDRAKLQGSVNDAIGEFHRLGTEGEQEGRQAGTATGTAIGAGLGVSLDSALDQAKDKLRSKLQGLAEGGAPAGKLIGAGVGLALVGALVTAINMEPARAKLTAQLGLTSQESARLGGVAGKLYASNYGEGLEDVTSAIRLVVQNIDGMRTASSDDLQAITGKVMSLSSAFDQDLGATTRAVGQMIRTGLAKDANEALDIITVGFQNGADKAEDFLDTLNEYGVQFQKLGIDGKTATGLITQGLQAGARDADKVADAFKEFSIRAIDGSEQTSKAFTQLGLDAGQMQQAIAAGGSTAAKATDSVLDALRNVKDPAQQAAIATALFGTQAEDLGKALFALDLDTAAAGLGKVEGAAAKVDEAMSGTAQGAINQLIRGLAVLADQIGSALLPVIKPLIQAAAGLGEALGDLLGWVMDLPGPLLAGAAALVGWQIVTSLGPAVTAFGTALGRAATAVRGFIAALGPVGLIITGVTVALGFLMDSSHEVEDTIQAQSERWDRLVGTLDKVSGAVTDATRAQLASEAQQSGMLDTLNRLGVSTKDYIDASAGVAGAQEKLAASVGKAASGVLQQSAAYKAVAEDLAAAGISQREFTAALEEADPTVQAQKMQTLQEKVNEYAEAQARASGQASDATAIQERFAAAVAEGQDPLAALGGILNMAGSDAAGFGEEARKAAQIGAALGTAGETAGGGLDAAGAAAASAEDALGPMTDALDGASKATSDLDSATKYLQITLDEAAGGVVSMEAAQRAAESATRDIEAATRDQADALQAQKDAEAAAKKAVQEHGKGSQEATKAQREYESATDDAKDATDKISQAGQQPADQAISYAGTLIQNGRANGTLESATKQATEAIARARDAFIAAQPEADRLSGKANKTADALFGIPRNTVARIAQTGAAQVQSAGRGVTRRSAVSRGTRTTNMARSTRRRASGEHRRADQRYPVVQIRDYQIGRDYQQRRVDGAVPHGGGVMYETGAAVRRRGAVGRGPRRSGRAPAVG